MRVMLSTYDSRGGVEPLVGLAVRSAGKAASVRGNHAGSSSQDPEHENVQTLLT
jgi:hypothetical protein